MIQSWAAHNEYLRMAVEGGQLGRGLLIVLFVLRVVGHTRRLCQTDKVIMRLAFVAFAVHAYTDNVLIATTACVFFGFATAVFARQRVATHLAALLPDRPTSDECAINKGLRKPTQSSPALKASLSVC